MPLMPINRQKKIKTKSISLDKLDLDSNSLSGDLIDGGVITNFSSTGITDKSTQNQITIKDGLIEVAKDVHIRGKILVDELQYVAAQVPKLNVTKAIMIDHNEVLWKHELGRSVKHSNLESVGVLKELQISDVFYAKEGRVGVNTTAPSDVFSVNAKGIEVKIGSNDATAQIGTHLSAPMDLVTDNTARLSIGSNGKIIIKKDLTVLGCLGVGVNNPTQSLDVSGNIKFRERTFSSGEESPTTGVWTKGSIVWNEHPDKGLPVGWVCVKGGKPGAWRPFGIIA